MKIGFFLSTHGGSPLVDGLRRGLSSNGHTVEDYRVDQGYGMLFVFNQCAHNPSYAYPDFPPPSQSIVFIDTAEYGYFKRLPGVVQDYANTFSNGAMNHDTKSIHEQTRMKRFLEGRSFPYFIREFSNYVNFPQGYYPIDYPLYVHSSCPIKPSLDTYLKRDLDLFVSWGASHPWRMNITKALRDAHTKCEISVIGESGHQRMPQYHYFDRTQAAKASVSFDGYGSGSFRVHEVLVRTVLLQGPLTIRQRSPLVDGVTCVDYSVANDGETFVSTDVAQKLRRVLDHPEWAYRIYERGYHHCMEHYTEEATARYVLKAAALHDYKIPTKLDL